MRSLCSCKFDSNFDLLPCEVELPFPPSAPQSVSSHTLPLGVGPFFCCYKLLTYIIEKHCLINMYSL